MLPPRWLPQKSLPPYAYLPGKNPHPVRDPAGHSYHVEPIPVAAEVSLSPHYARQVGECGLND